MRRLTLILLLLPLLAAAPTAQARATGKHVVTRPEWAVKPDAGLFSRYFPERAEREEVSGAAVISCGVAVSGDLRTCKLVSESPAGYGFGDAALRMAPHMKMTPATRDGEPVATGAVRIPLKFELGPSAPQPIDPAVQAAMDNYTHPHRSFWDSLDIIPHGAFHMIWLVALLFFGALFRGGGAAARATAKAARALAERRARAGTPTPDPTTPMAPFKPTPTPNNAIVETLGRRPKGNPNDIIS
ncbi:MAG: energy transducer TonB [Caulobacter sp.]|nr:energy transducer TonB [Caulobacter sp.]